MKMKMKTTEIMVKPLTIAQMPLIKKLAKAKKLSEEVEALAELTGYEKMLIYRLDVMDYAKLKGAVYDQILFKGDFKKKIGEYELVDFSKACVAWQMDMEQVLSMPDDSEEKDLLLICCMYKKKGEHYADGDLDEKRKFFINQPISIYIGLMDYFKKKEKTMRKLQSLINR